MNKLPSLAPTTMGEAIEFSKMLASSTMVPQQYRNKPQDILVAVQWGYELNLQPMQSLQNIAVINGKPSIFGDAALALVKNDPRCLGVREWTEGEGDDRTAWCEVKRQIQGEVEKTCKGFSVADAKRARLWGKQGPWTQYPERMLMFRARGFALRDSFPDALKGMITQEEASDYPEPKDVTPKQNPLDAIEAAPAAVEAPVVEDVPPAPEAPPASPEPETEAVSFVVKTAKGKVHESFEDAGQFVDAFLGLIERYAGAKTVASGQTVTPREKMTMLRELKEANQESLDNLSEEQLGMVSDLYSKSLKRLGAESNG